jgi:hypothetical protein
MANRLLRCTLRLLVLCALLIPTATCTAENCPWINQATASGLLGADSTAAYTPAASGQPAVCTFTEADSRKPRTLEVRVETVPQARTQFMALASTCTGETSPLPAIGNEAVNCAADVHKDKPAERVIGYVRDQLFIITLSSSGKQDAALSRHELQMRIATAAEQVAGNLF